MFVPYPHMDRALDHGEELPKPDYGKPIFGNDQVEAAYRRWYDYLIASYLDEPTEPPEITESVLAVLDEARLLEHSKVHLPPDHRFYNQVAAADAAFFFDADLAHDSSKIECHLIGGDGYVGLMALLVRLRDHPAARAYRDDPQQYAKWVGRNVRGPWEHHYETYCALSTLLGGEDQPLARLMHATLLHADSYPHFFSALNKKIGRSKLIHPWEFVENVGPNKLHFLLRTTERDDS